ncbi:MAG: hypothetical protein ACSHWZ_03380 [Sulfitobacter sp.]
MKTPLSRLSIAAEAAHFRAAQQQVIEKLPTWRDDYPELSFALDCVLVAVIKALIMTDGHPVNRSDQRLAKKGAVMAAIIQNIPAVEATLDYAQYSAAAALVRQEMEAIEALRGIQMGKPAPPNRSYGLGTFKHLGRTYGQLSGLHHSTKDELIAHLTGDGTNSVDPIYNKEFAKFLLNTHIQCLAFLSMHMSEELKSPENRDLFEASRTASSEALGILTDAGFLTLKPSP